MLRPRSFNKFLVRLPGNAMFGRSRQEYGEPELRHGTCLCALSEIVALAIRQARDGPSTPQLQSPHSHMMDSVPAIERELCDMTPEKAWSFDHLHLSEWWVSRLANENSSLLLNGSSNRQQTERLCEVHKVSVMIPLCPHMAYKCYSFCWAYQRATGFRLRDHFLKHSWDPDQNRYRTILFGVWMG